MSQVDFYILKNRSATAIFPFLCKLIEKGYKQGSHFFIKLTNEQDAQTLDALLWTYSDITFLPHRLILSKNAIQGGQGNQGSQAEKNNLSETPILLGLDPTPEISSALTKKILVNLTDAIPENIAQFKRIIEVVPDEEPWKSNSRKKYGEYQKINLELKTHAIS